MEKNMVAMKASAHLSHMVLTACAKIKDGVACKQQLQRLWELGWVVQAEDANIAVALVRVFLTYLNGPLLSPSSVKRARMQRRPSWRRLSQRAMITASRARSVEW